MFRAAAAALLCLLAMTAAPGPARAQQADEVLQFKMYWGILPVGTSTLTASAVQTPDGGAARRYELDCRSNALVDLVCKVRDRLVAVAAMDLSRSLAYNKTLREGSEHRDFAVRMDWERQRSLRLDRLANNTLQRPVPPGTMDPLSVFYDFRQRFQKGQERMAATVTDGLYTVKARARALDVEPLGVPYGEFEARKVQVCMPRVDGIFRASEPGCYFVWISQDGLPLKIQARVRVAGFLGDLSVELARVSSQQPAPR